MSSPLYANLSALAEAHRECMALIARLAKLSGSSVEGVRSDLANEIHESLKHSENELDLLQAQIDAEPQSDSREALLSKCAKLADDLKAARLAYRKAQLLSKKNAELERKREREALFGDVGAGRPSMRSRKAPENQTQDDVVLSAASDVTASLRRTHAMLSQELQQSRFAHETLSASTVALKELSTRYSRLDDIMMSSRRLITDLVRKNKSDAWYYEKAIYTLAGTLAWLIFRRWLYGPLWLFVWLPFNSVWWMIAVIFGGGSKQVGVPQPIGSVKEPLHTAFDTSQKEVGGEEAKRQMAHIKSVESIIDSATRQTYTPSPEPPAPELTEEARAEPEAIKPNPKKRMMEVPEAEMAEQEEEPGSDQQEESKDAEVKEEKTDDAPAAEPEPEPKAAQPNPIKRMMEVSDEDIVEASLEDHDEL